MGEDHDIASIGNNQSLSSRENIANEVDSEALLAAIKLMEEFPEVFEALAK